jgi:hypothetical protein
MERLTIKFTGRAKIFPRDPVAWPVPASNSMEVSKLLFPLLDNSVSRASGDEGQVGPQRFDSLHLVTCPYVSSNQGHFSAVKQKIGETASQLMSQPVFNWPVQLVTE